MAVGDINGDGLDDIYVGHYNYGIKVPYILPSRENKLLMIHSMGIGDNGDGPRCFFKMADLGNKWTRIFSRCHLMITKYLI